MISHHNHPIGVTRRELLQVGYSGLLGVGLSSLAASAPAARGAVKPSRKPKSVLIVFLTGAASHIDTFDPKPDAPDGIRGEFKVIPTKVPGLMVTELLPKLAARADKYALVRSLSHRDNNHTASTHHLITGAMQPGVRFDKPASRDDWPCYAAGLSYLRPRSDGLPSGIMLPTFLSEGPLTWPGQHAGFLGPKHDPWQIAKDPNAPDFKVDNLRLAPGLDVENLSDRMALLDEVNRGQKYLSEAAECRKLTDQQHRAVSLLTSGSLAKAFDLDREPAKVRDKYGRHTYGQSLLLARRLVQAGVPVVQANMGRVQSWDSHGNIFPTLKNRLVPPLDVAVSALLDDLSESGLLEETMVMMLGEFGRTPKIGTEGGKQKVPGRDHWGPCFFGLFAGAGVIPGQVIGRSDKIGAFPATTPYSPDDVGATVYHVLGIDPSSEIRDRQDRPTAINRGQVIEPLFTGRA
jgi:hypothetical protein